MTISNKRLLITGGSRGIGYEIARSLASAGARVWLCSRTINTDSLQPFLDTQARASAMDIGREESVRAVFNEIKSNWGGLDGIIHAAADLGETGPFWNLDVSQLEKTIQTNTVGSFIVAKLFTQMFIQTSSPGERGKIVLFAGGGAGYGYPNFIPYGISKAAAVRMCETMAMELKAAQVDIDVNIIAPGANETEMLRKVRAAGGLVRTVVPFSKPIALTQWLLSQRSDGVSGRFFHVNDPFETVSANNLSENALTLRRIDI